MTADRKDLTHSHGAARLAIGLAQGLALFFMFKAAELKVWPATNLPLYEALALPLVFAPLVVVHGLSQLPRRTLAIWAGTAAAVCAALGAYDGYRFPDKGDEVILVTFPLIPVLAIGLFVAQALVLAAHADGKRIAGYPTYFDAAWKHGVQLAAGVGFTAALWILIFLGSRLFELIKLDFLSNLIEEQWFSIPITTMALAASIQVTDVRPALVRGIRTLALTLLSWLLPVIVVIVAGFLASLPFTGLQPLWDTRFAASLLLAVAAALIVLINAAYQDGTPEHMAGPVVRWTMIGAAVLPTPLICIAAYALMLRVRQYGWTEDRVLAFACIVVGACYSVGYLIAALRPRDLLKRLEPTNIATSFVVLVILVALFSPIADPVRIGVANQVARLQDGRTSAVEFDYAYLRFQGGRFGASALARMKDGEIQVAGVPERAAQAMTLEARHVGNPAITQDIASNVTIAAGKEIPASFITQDWAVAVKERADIPACLRQQGARCEAFLLDFTGDGVDEILLIPEDGSAAPTLFHHGDGGWARAGALPRGLACPDFKDRLRAGAVGMTPSRWRDLEIGGARWDVAETSPLDAADCAPR